MEVISLGVLTESRGQGTRLVYVEGGEQGNSVQFRFPVVHLAGWLACWGTLEKEAATNPFALVIMAQLQANQTRKQGRQRLASKTQIASLMYRYRYSRQDIEQGLRIIDWMMQLPVELEPAFNQAMNQAMTEIEQENNVAYVPA